MTPAKSLVLSLADVEKALGAKLDEFYHSCHAASLALVRSGMLGESARVARGSARGVGGQHSWAVAGDPYDPAAPIVDVTLWSYVGGEPDVWVGSLKGGVHRPAGYSSIFADGMPTGRGGDEPITLEGLSEEASRFLSVIGPMDAYAWMQLFNSGMLHWPSAEIITAAYQKEELRALIPIDIAGMLTDFNPGKLYF
jgi:hypothetical protein